MVADLRTRVQFPPPPPNLKIKPSEAMALFLNFWKLRELNAGTGRTRGEAETENAQHFPAERPNKDVRAGTSKCDLVTPWMACRIFFTKKLSRRLHQIKSEAEARSECYNFK